MAKIFHTIDEGDELLEKAFKEGCEHGYRKAMRNYSERTSYREGFEEKIERLKDKYK